MPNPSEEMLKLITRRQLFRDCGTGMGVAALAMLLNGKSFGFDGSSTQPTSQPVASGPLAPKLPQFAAKAKRVIYMHMAGAPSQLDLFDFKPKLAQLNGQAIPKEFVKGERFAFIKGDPKLLGRDHHPRAFTMWMAGGGIKGGITIGETDELGYNVTTDPVHVHDLQATILQCLGMDHTKLTYRYQGRDFRLTDVSGEVVKKILV